MTAMFVVSCDCGYRKASKTQPLAERGLVLHSCERQRMLGARAARVEAQRASEGMIRECEHKQSTHVHGTRTAYVLDRCRCRPCRDAASATERRRARMIAYGRHDVGRVAAAPVRERCLELRAQGVGLKQLARVAGVSTATLGKLLYGVPSRGVAPRARVEVGTAERIMAVRPSPDVVAGGVPVSSVGSARRLQALMCLGYSGARLGERLGMSGPNLNALMRRDRVVASTARAVRELYDELWATPARGTDQRSRISVSRAVNYATAHGFAPPLAWDDETIDDPAARPSGVDRPVGPNVPTLERLEDLEHLLDTGTGYAELLARLGTNRSTLDHAIRRAGRQDLAARLVARADQRRSAAA